MIKVFMNDGDDFIIDMGDEQKEISLVYKFNNGINPKASMKITMEGGAVKKVEASRINNMQFFTRPLESKQRMFNPLESLAWIFGKGGRA
jgi:hypothetical protein